MLESFFLNFFQHLNNGTALAAVRSEQFLYKVTLPELKMYFIIHNPTLLMYIRTPLIKLCMRHPEQLIFENK